ncbi:hypothetical protein [Gimesia sp.]|uniref:hypothetical protein n=1 Tax=Gimesia sp. TaxID=2024833 RepID=UPI003A94DF5E
MSENKHTKLIRFLFYVIPILLVVYVLSIGPIAAILCDSNGKVINPEHEQWAIHFYSPLISVMKSNIWLEYLAGEYVEFCVDHF